jgi:hypothetical protein
MLTQLFINLVFCILLTLMNYFFDLFFDIITVYLFLTDILVLTLNNPMIWKAIWRIFTINNVFTTN